MKQFLRQILPVLVLFITLIGTGRAQSLLVDFQASGYTGGNTWTDAEGVTATYVGSSAAVANGTSVTTNGGFTFSTGDVAGLDGLTSYTETVTFIANSIVGGYDTHGFASYNFAGNGVFGMDINGFGQGDSGLSLSSYDNGIVAGAGTASRSDVALYDAGTPTGTFSLNTPIAAVMVVQGDTAGGANGSISLYVNGVLVDQQTGIYTQPFGQVQPLLGNGTVESQDFGIGTMVGAYGPGLDGSIVQEQIYSGAFSPASAATLSAELVPEPSAWAMTLAGGAVLLALAGRRRLS